MIGVDEIEDIRKRARGGESIASIARAVGASVLMCNKNRSEGAAVENLDQRSSRRPSHGIQRGAEKERPRDIHQARP